MFHAEVLARDPKMQLQQPLREVVSLFPVSWTAQVPCATQPAHGIGKQTAM